VLLPCTCVLQPTLVHRYQSSSLLPGHLPIAASASLRLLYLLLYREHINHIQILGFLPFPYSSCVCSLSFLHSFVPSFLPSFFPSFLLPFPLPFLTPFFPPFLLPSSSLPFPSPFPSLMNRDSPCSLIWTGTCSVI
jgi:hypothetical protein